MVDLVSVLNENSKEALYYYENNWKRHRVEAERRGFISGYRMLVRTAGTGKADILLITSYATEEQYDEREANFAIVMSSDGSDGLRLLNSKQPSEFRKVFGGGDYYEPE
jgi:hypothetical protein